MFGWNLRMTLFFNIFHLNLRNLWRFTSVRWCDVQAVLFEPLRMILFVEGCRWDTWSEIHVDILVRWLMLLFRFGQGSFFVRCWFFFYGVLVGNLFVLPTCSFPQVRGLFCYNFIFHRDINWLVSGFDHGWRPNGLMSKNKW